MSRRGLTRRGALAASAGAALLPAVWPFAARGEELMPRHGLTVIGDLKYPADFKHFDYVNPDAPKGGTIVTQSPTRALNQNFTTFNTLNMFVLRGDGAQGMTLTFASLMAAASDEPGSVYPYVARAVETSADRKVLVFDLNPAARFHDGTQITAADVVFSIEVLRDQGHPLLATDLKGVTAAIAVDDVSVRVELAPETGPSLPVTVAGLPIFSRTWWAGRDFQATLSVAPLGSGPYRVRDYRFPTYIAYERVPDFWAADLPVMKGRYNFDVIRYDYYRDRVTAFEAFKKGSTTLREEFTSRIWARDYNFPAVNDGRIVRDEIPDGSPSGGQGWFFNMRRSKFADRRVREALVYAFDFEWTNANIMFNSYRRTSSYFENSPLKAEGPPGPDELALLEPLREKLPEAAFAEPFVPPVSDGSGRDRSMLKTASDMLAAAGCSLKDGRLHTATGEPITIEFLDDDRTFEPHHNAFINGLRRLGVEASYRVVDAAQFTDRLKTFDFDMTVSRFSMALYPDESILNFFSSDSAGRAGSNNLSGIADPAIDALLQHVVHAATWEAFVTACRSLDRALRAGHYWIPHWYKGSHWLAYWDMFARPERKPPYDRAILDTWWVDAEKAAKLGKS